MYQGFKLNLDKRMEMIILGHFLRQQQFFWAAQPLPKNVSSLKSNHNSQVKLVQVPDKYGIIIF